MLLTSTARQFRAPAAATRITHRKPLAICDSMAASCCRFSFQPLAASVQKLYWHLTNFVCVRQRCSVPPFLGFALLSRAGQRPVVNDLMQHVIEGRSDTTCRMIERPIYRRTYVAAARALSSYKSAVSSAAPPKFYRLLTKLITHIRFPDHTYRPLYVAKFCRRINLFIYTYEF